MTLRPDPDRLRALARSPTDDALTHLPEQVLLHSRDLGWPGLLVWRQYGESRELYVPPLAQHALLIRLGRPTHTVQMRIAEERPEQAVQRQAFWACGEVSIVPAGEASYWANDCGSDNLHIDVEPTLIEDFARAHGHTHTARIPLRSYHVIHDERLRLIGEALLDALQYPTPDDLLVIETLGHTLAAHLLTRYAEPGWKPTRSSGLSQRQLREVMAFIEEHLDQRLTLATLAEQANISVWHFARCFKRATGQSPHRYIQEVRLQRALALLKGSGRPIVDIALSLGFADAGHFSRSFKARFGRSPRFYRQQP